MFEFFVSNPELLWWKLVACTVVEALVGLALMLGFMTRLAGLVTSLLAFGILLGPDWLGTTCLDEWQVGVLGIGSGLAFVFSGGGQYSLDYPLRSKAHKTGALVGVGLFTGRCRIFGLSQICRCICCWSVWTSVANQPGVPRRSLGRATQQARETKGGALFPPSAG